jgi:SAM-dependent methyltransferase
VSVDRTRIRELQAAFAARGDYVGWFDALYREAGGDPGVVPWADLRPTPQVARWVEAHPSTVRGARCLVVGCGLGDDAELLAEAGGAVTAFDVSPAAIEWCRRRFPDSRVDYQVANLLAAPDAWRGAFGLVLEVNTLQALPASIRPQAMAAVADLVAPLGRLFVVCRGRDEDEPEGEVPWPLTRPELDRFGAHGLTQLALAEDLDGRDPPVRRFVADFAREVGYNPRT